MSDKITLPREVCFDRASNQFVLEENHDFNGGTNKLVVFAEGDTSERIARVVPLTHAEVVSGVTAALAAKPAKPGK